MAEEIKIHEKRPPFSKEGILKKQALAKEDYEKKLLELRQMFESVAATPNGEKVLRYLFLMTGGDSSSVRRNKEGVVSINDTMLTLGAKSVWETLRYSLTSETLTKIEQHTWEDN